MIEENDKEIQKLENKINMFKRIHIVGLILIIISFCCMGLLVLRINQFGLEMDTFWIYNTIVMFISLSGITLMSIGNRYRRFKIMREEYLIQSEERTKLSFKVDSKD